MELSQRLLVPCIQYIQFRALNILLLHGVRKNVTPAEKKWTYLSSLICTFVLWNV